MRSSDGGTKGTPRHGRRRNHHNPSPHDGVIPKGGILQPTEGSRVEHRCTVSACGCCLRRMNIRGVHASSLRPLEKTRAFGMTQMK
jgi:hypothetical protein